MGSDGKFLMRLQETKKVVDPKCEEGRNNKGQSPSQLFDEEHEKPIKEAEKWSKETATCLSVASGLIITIMFPGLLTLPGGNDQTTGYPIFRKENLFVLYVVAASTSFVSAIASLLTFIVIHTSHYTEIGFLRYVLKKFIFGLSTFCLSAIAMMIACGAAVSLILRGRLEMIKLVIYLAVVPIIIFSIFPFRFVFEISSSIYRPTIFSTKKKKTQTVKYY